MAMEFNKSSHQDEMIQALFIRIVAIASLYLSTALFSYWRLIAKKNKRTLNVNCDLTYSIASVSSIVSGILCHDADGTSRVYYNEIRDSQLTLAGHTIQRNSPSDSNFLHKQETSFVSVITTPIDTSFMSGLHVVPEELSVGNSNSIADGSCHDEDEDEYDYIYENESEIDGPDDGSCSSDGDEPKPRNETRKIGAPFSVLSPPTCSSINTMMAKQSELFYMRVCDLSFKIISEIGDSLTVSRKVHPMTTSPNSPTKGTNSSLTWLGIGDNIEISESAVSALLSSALDFITGDEKSIVVWSPDKATTNVLNSSTYEQTSYMESNILFWNGKIKQTGKYGSNYPAIKYKGFINMSPKALISLIMDSKRINEYNNSSLGREDVHIFEKGFEDHGVFRGETKIVRNRTQVPIIGKVLEITSLMHGRKLQSSKNGETYIVITRAVRANTNSNNTSEIILGANLIHVSSQVFVVYFI